MGPHPHDDRVSADTVQHAAQEPSQCQAPPEVVHDDRTPMVGCSGIFAGPPCQDWSKSPGAGHAAPAPPDEQTVAQKLSIFQSMLSAEVDTANIQELLPNYLPNTPPADAYGKAPVEPPPRGHIEQAVDASASLAAAPRSSDQPSREQPRIALFDPNITPRVTPVEDVVHHEQACQQYSAPNQNHRSNTGGTGDDGLAAATTFATAQSDVMLHISQAAFSHINGYPYQHTSTSKSRLAVDGEFMYIGSAGSGRRADGRTAGAQPRPGGRAGSRDDFERPFIDFH